jgi:outer membrane biosynthesis protein TonB
MNVLTCGRVALACALAFAGAAHAQQQQTAPTPATAPAAKPAAPAAAPVKPAAPSAAAPAQRPAAQTSPTAPAAGAPAAGMSESKYLSLLYSEIEKHTPADNPAGPGEVTASFIVGASGKVEKVTIDRTSSPAHAEVVKKILSQVVTPPPPGGSMDVGQTFKFR